MAITVPPLDVAITVPPLDVEEIAAFWIRAKYDKIRLNGIERALLRMKFKVGDQVEGGALDEVGVIHYINTKNGLVDVEYGPRLGDKAPGKRRIIPYDWRRLKKLVYSEHE